jgi:hypothetical protein
MQAPEHRLTLKNRLVCVFVASFVVSLHAAVVSALRRLQQPSQPSPAVCTVPSSSQQNPCQVENFPADLQLYFLKLQSEYIFSVLSRRSHSRFDFRRQLQSPAEEGLDGRF